MDKETLKDVYELACKASDILEIEITDNPTESAMVRHRKKYCGFNENFR